MRPSSLWGPRAAAVSAAFLVIAVLVPREADPATRAVFRITVDGPISPAVADFLSTTLAAAEKREAAAVLVVLDTPGGLLNSTKTIVKDILDAPLPVIVYVSPGGAGATSAGVFITLAAHVAAMAPGTTIGAAHPVSGQGTDIEGDMRTKIENYAAAFASTLAERRGRNVAWAKKAVRESEAITETEALEHNVIDLVAADVEELLRAASGREVDIAGNTEKLDFSDSITSAGHAVIVDIEMTLRQRVLTIIADPNIAYLLMAAGMLGLYFEFSNPGTIFPGVVGAICLLLALLAGQVLPISSVGVLLIVLGMAFLFAELLLPSFGILGVGGIVALTLGSLFLYTRESGLQVDRSLITGTVVVFATALALIVGLLLGDRRKKSTTGAEGLVGERGVTLTDVHRSGKVKLHGEIWNAVSDEPIEPKKPIRVETVVGLKLHVREERE